MPVEDLRPFTPRVLALAEKYQFPQKHSRQVAALAQQLFDQLRPLHGLPGNAAVLLEHGALLHDIGYFIAHKRHHRHGAYLVENDVLLRDYPATERQMLTLLVRNHRKKPLDPAEVLSGKDAAMALALCGLLNVADGLDYAHDSCAHVLDVAVDATGISLLVSGCDIAALQKVLHRKAALMQVAFKRTVHFVPEG